MAGIGVTMSLFISDLGFSDASLVDAAKIGFLTASLLLGAVGWTIRRGVFLPALAEASSEAPQPPRGGHPAWWVRFGGRSELSDRPETW